MSKVDECKRQELYHSIANFKNYFDDALRKLIQPNNELLAKIAVSKVQSRWRNK